MFYLTLAGKHFSVECFNNQISSVQDRAQDHALGMKHFLPTTVFVPYFVFRISDFPFFDSGLLGCYAMCTGKYLPTGYLFTNLYRVTFHMTLIFKWDGASRLLHLAANEYVRSATSSGRFIFGGSIPGLL
jgi:hypothetical protein